MLMVLFTLSILVFFRLSIKKKKNENKKKRKKKRIRTILFYEFKIQRKQIAISTELLIRAPSMNIQLKIGPKIFILETGALMMRKVVDIFVQLIKTDWGPLLKWTCAKRPERMYKNEMIIKYLYHNSNRFSKKLNKWLLHVLNESKKTKSTLRNSLDLFVTKK